MNTVILLKFSGSKIFRQAEYFFSNNRKAKFFCENVQTTKQFVAEKNGK